MSFFEYTDNTLHAEGVALTDIADEFGTPCFVYSRAALEAHYLSYTCGMGDLPHLICYAVKANSNLAVIDILARLGAGFDIVSGGELQRVIAAGGAADKIIFSGLGKSETEIRQALELGIACFNVESEPELERINSIALSMQLRAPISLRVNPDVDALTHPYISTGLKENKFGIGAERALAVFRHAATLEGIELIGIDCHIGSQLTSLSPYIDAVNRLLAMIDELAAEGIVLRHFDIGGGLGVEYDKEVPPQPAELVDAIRDEFMARNLTLLMEPGRSIAANAGVFLTRIEYLKYSQHKNFAVVDGAMNDLLRPALYSAWQKIEAVQTRSEGELKRYDVVGPVCESADFLGKDREFAVAQGDLLAVRSAGAYGFVMSSNYNSRGRAAEIMVDGDKTYRVRKRENIADQLALESCLPGNN